MKKLIGLSLITLLVFAGLSACAPQETLRVFSWGVYIDEELIAQFEEENNVRVIYDEFASNEEMYTRLLSGEQYDVLVPSDYTIERLIQENLLQRLDLSKISNRSNLIPELVGLPHDPQGQYSMPYFWGNVGLVYNKNNVSYDDLELLGWEILRNTNYAGRIYFYDSERDAFMIALKALGYSANTTNEAEIQEAYEWLLEMDATMDVVYVTDEIIDSMIAGNKDIAVMYSGDAVYVSYENEEMGFYVPEQGTNLWVDSMVIPANARNVELAHKWIDFMLSHEAALANTIEVAYTTPIQSVFDEVTSEGGDYEDYLDSYVPRLDNPLDEVFRYNNEIKKLLSDLYTLVKAQ
jgi:spermidine/putrescine transport system substrate-binding protein